MKNKNTIISLIWNALYGNQYETKDIFGYWMTKDNCTIDHVFPLSKGGSEDFSNLFIMSEEANRMKADNTRGIINGIRFSITIGGIGEDGGRIGIYNFI